MKNNNSVKPNRSAKSKVNYDLMYRKDRMPEGQSGLSFEEKRVARSAYFRAAFITELCARRQFFLTIRTLRGNLRRSAFAAELRACL